MRRTTLVLALTALLGSSALAQNTDADKDKDANKEVTVRGVIAGVTVEGETAVNFVTHRAETVETTFVTIVGSTTGDDTSKADKDQSTAGRRRHNVYVVWLTPKTTFHDATAAKDSSSDKKESIKTALDKVEVGDRVEATFHRREFSRSGGNDATAQKSKRHGRHRTYFGDAVSLTILAEPDRGSVSKSEQDKDRDDDKDKTKDKDK